ncbi:NUDIX domain-containing protein [uncultured Ruminococcus sp.]|uniref:NUDIX hydrolase n=1 Tax=uncultured Ruminococcus sp. TaxID=165186 RepID=UPI0025EB5546|nr:NUDIX domain-containing protein [uncultured Ruminococcus sp.]
MEFLDIVDENGEPSGGIIDRETAHLKGIRHRTSHLWLLRRRGGSVQILLQKRAENKASYPACYDISSAGHIPAGCGYVPSALRELKEELGADAQADELICIGRRTIVSDEIFFGKEFHDRQVSKVFVLWRDMDEAEFSLQKEEVDSVRWMDFDECFESVSNNTIRHCIAVEELMMIKEYLKNGGDML